MWYYKYKAQTTHIVVWGVFSCLYNILLTIKKRRGAMARPIKETPVLKGKDAKHFEYAIKNNEQKKVSSSDYQRAQETYKKITISV